MAQSAIGASTDWLIIGEKAGSKLGKARRLNESRRATLEALPEDASRAGIVTIGVVGVQPRSAFATEGAGMLTIEVRDGQARVVVDPRLSVDRETLSFLSATADVHGHLLPDGYHSLDTLADVIDKDNEEDSPVRAAVADQLRQLAGLYTPGLKADPAFVVHEENTEGRDFVVGDIHGQYDALQDALRAVDFDRRRDRLFCVGDLIDRGARSFDCLSLVFEPFCHCVLGNHEWLALTALGDQGTRHDWDLWQTNGGGWIHGENAREVKIRLEEAARYLPLGREVGVDGKRIGICHAEPPRNWNGLRESPESLLEPTIWSRSRIREGDITPVGGIDAVVVGHTPVPEPRWLGNVFYADTGAFLRDGKLTLVNLADLAARVRSTP